ncbi:HPP family protein [Patulibacter sp.]|uniref:HPP family protein n=1 Tax=Patulibacter sp. TaxID=1912859 RepID=UPI00271D5C3C|nr:HPP family protein [Patulibacter sp.]MDO9407914.1 HPP family protein [Patulibacter sp.]
MLRRRMTPPSPPSRRSGRVLEVALPHLRLGVGIFCSALVLALVGAAADTPLLIAPLVATAALKHAAPHDPGVAPRRVVLGHLVGATAGMTAGALLGEGAIAIALAAAGAAVLMRALDVMHAPAVATAYVAVQEHADHWFPLHVALAGAAVLVATTVVLSPLLHGRRYPVRRAVPVVAGE